MITDQKVWDIEKSYLENVIAEIKTQLDHCINATGNYKKEAIAMQKEMWQDSKGMRAADLDGAVEAWQYQTDISKQALKYKFSRSTLNRLEKMYQNPYFGRINFIEQDEEDTEQIYIGIYNLSSNNNSDILVYDWRTPIASLFYDYEIGSCSYNCPAGLISGQMSLKRQYKIENQNMIYMFDSSLRINDEMLQEILGKSTDSRMKTIVTSIQREQNSIIRNDQNKILIVQGSAGSGKTSIALHRAAYLLYKHRETIKPENILILSPNHVFEEYISNVLPELGEDNVESSTFADFFGNMLDTKYRLETSNEQMEYILSEHFDQTRIKCIEFKTSRCFLNILKKYVSYIEMGNSIAFKDLIYDGQLIISANDIAQLFKNETVHIPFAKRLQKLQLRLLYLLEPYQQARTNEISESDIFDENDLTDNEKKTIIAQKVATEFESIKNDIAQMASFDVHQLYSDLFKNIASFTDSSTKMDYADLNNISTYTLDLLLTNTLNYEDIAPIVFLKTVFDNVNTTKAIKHIIIDEAQDYTAIQYEVFKNAFDHCNMTILGDLNQSMNAYMNIGSFDSIADTFNNQDTTSILLSKSYRSTKQIADFCNALLTKQNNAEQLNRHGCKPNVIKVARSSRPQKIVDQINIFQSKDYKLIAVICKTARDCQDLYNSISPYMDICLISNQKELYQGGVVIIPSYLAKGLEFDAVIVSSVDNDDFSKEEDRKLLYTVCTRALHELSLYYFDNLSRFIKEMDENLYVTNQSSID